MVFRRHRAAKVPALLATLRREWVPRLSQPAERNAVTAVFLALALVGAPLAGSIRAVCDQCPRTCPMHQPHTTKPGKPSCHAAGTVAHHEEPRSTASPGFARPPCSHHGTVPGVAVAPMILPAAVRSRFVLITRNLGAPSAARGTRSNDPPDTPPPIVSV